MGLGREMSIKCLSHRHKDSGLDTQHPRQISKHEAVHICNQVLGLGLKQWNPWSSLASLPSQWAPGSVKDPVSERTEWRAIKKTPGTSFWHPPTRIHTCVHSHEYVCTHREHTRSHICIWHTDKTLVSPLLATLVYTWKVHHATVRNFLEEVSKITEENM